MAQVSSSGTDDWDDDKRQGPDDPIDVLAHREHDDCAWLFGRECDCSEPGRFAEKLKALDLTLVPGLGRGSVALHEEAMSWTDPFDANGPRERDYRKAADLETLALLRVFLEAPDRMRTRAVLAESASHMASKEYQRLHPK